MRTLPITEELLKHCNEFFNDYDIILMLFIIVLLMSIGMSVIKLSMPDNPIA